MKTDADTKRRYDEGLPVPVTIDGFTFIFHGKNHTNHAKRMTVEFEVYVDSIDFSTIVKLNQQVEFFET